MNTAIHIPFQIMVFSRCMPTSGMQDHMEVLFFVLRNLHTVLQNGFNNLHPHQQCMRPPFSPHPLQHLLLVNFLKMAILTSARWLHCSFYISPIMNNVEHFSCTFWSCACLPWRNVYLERPPVFWLAPTSRECPLLTPGPGPRDVPPSFSHGFHWWISWMLVSIPCAQFPLHSYCLSMILSFFKIHMYTPSNTLSSQPLFQPLPLHINKPHHHLELNHIRNHESEQVTPWPQPTYSTLIPSLPLFLWFLCILCIY